MPSKSLHAVAWVEDILDRAIAANGADFDLNRFRAIGNLSTAYLEYARAESEGDQVAAAERLTEVERLAEPLR